MRRTLLWFATPMALLCFAGANAAIFVSLAMAGNWWFILNIVAMVYAYRVGMRVLVRMIDMAVIQTLGDVVEGRIELKKNRRWV